MSLLRRALVFGLSRFMRSVSGLGNVLGLVSPQVGCSTVLPGHLGSLRCAWRPGSFGGASGACGPYPRHVARSSPRTPPSALALPLSLAQGHSQSSSRFHLARSVWLHGSFRQELSISSCRHSCSSASANGPVESRSTAGVTRRP